MNLTITLLARNPALLSQWKAKLEPVFKSFQGIDFKFNDLTGEQMGQLIFVDEKLKDKKEVLKAIHRGGRAVFLIVENDSQIPVELLEGAVDDVLVAPFRAVEVIGKLRLFQQILRWDEVVSLNASYSEAVGLLHQDLELAERIQKARLPKKFPDIPGFQVRSRYMAGMKSGGDYFDVTASSKLPQMQLMLADSSSYGLSSAFMSVLMKVAMLFNKDQIRGPGEVVQALFTELAPNFSPKDQLSLFWGTLQCKDLGLRYTHLGGNSFFHSIEGERFEVIPSQSGPLHLSEKTLSGVMESELSLHPSDRLVLLSDGFVELSGGVEKSLDLLNQFYRKDPLDLLNEFTFQVKKKLPSGEEFPEQDCSALVLDVASNVIHLAS